MIRKSILTILGGVVFAAVLGFAAPASAGCWGLCQDRIGDYVYQGCTIQVIGDQGTVTCYYTHEPPPPDNPIITD